MKRVDKMVCITQTILTDRQTGNYLSADNMHCVKGIFAICVLLHHLYQYSGLLRNGFSAYIGACFQALGFFSVAIFFFLSGYGLMKSSGTKDNIRKFPSHKILPFYLLILFFTLLYAAVDLITGREISANKIIMSLTFGGTIIVNGWYLQVQLLYYVLFYCVIRFAKEKNTIIIMTVLHALYVFICASVGLSSLFYERTFIFVLGMIWAEYRHKIDFW